MTRPARLRTVVLDCPNPLALAEFYRALTAVLALGARKHNVQPGETGDDNFRVYLDPVGHGFCLCWD